MGGGEAEEVVSHCKADAAGGAGEDYGFRGHLFYIYIYIYLKCLYALWMGDGAVWVNRFSPVTVISNPCSY